MWLELWNKISMDLRLNLSDLSPQTKGTASISVVDGQVTDWQFNFENQKTIDLMKGPKDEQRSRRAGARSSNQ